MKHGIAQIDEISDFDEIIDVRTPAEFAEDHVPGAINCPVLDNAQRIEVGTLYKQVSPFAAKKIGAAYVSENISRHLREHFLDKPKNWRPLILCWRGGERSGAMTHVFRRIGWDAHQLDGGYKSYRRSVVQKLEALPPTLKFRVICGATGSGKSRVLQALEKLNEQVLDLETLACHKGSVLGVLPDTRQPSQKAFESSLLLALQGLDPERITYVEAESRKIGCLQVPTALLETIRAGECIAIDATLEARVDFLLGDYDYFLKAPDWLNERLNALRELQSRETIARWQSFIAEARWRELVGELLALHYDPLYNRSQKQNFSGFGNPNIFSTDDLSEAGIQAIAARIIAQAE